jgi:integrase
MEKRIKGVYERDKGSGIWWIRYWDTAKGRIVREKIGNKAAAIKLYQKRKTEVLQRVKLPENFRAKPVELQELIKEAMQHSETNNRGHKQDRLRLLEIEKEFGNRIAESITPHEINRWLSSQGWAAGTINRHHSTFSLVFRLGIEARKLKDNPLKQVKRRREDNGRVRFLNDDEETRLRAVIASRWPQHMPEFDIALNTGLRNGEQYALTWENVDFARKLLTVSQTKNGETRHIPLNSAALAAFNQLFRSSTGSGYVFINRLGERLLKGRHWFERAIKEARIDGFTWHCLRHTFASKLAMADVSIITIKTLMGHKSMQMTTRYAHLAPAHQLAAVEKLCSAEAPLGGPTDTRTDTAQISFQEANTASVH